MASHRRTLVSRQNRDEVSSPAQRNNRPSESSHREPIALPPYQPPSLPLTTQTRQALVTLASNSEYRSYERHMKKAIENITTFVAESNDRWYDSKEDVERLAKRRIEAGDDAEKSDREVAAEKRARVMERKVERITAESEKALREVIDMQMEFAEQSTILQSVASNAATSAEAAEAAIEARGGAAAGRRNKRARPRNDSDDEDQEAEEDYQDESEEMMDVSDDVTFESPVELLKKAKEQYNAMYNAQDMYTRYATHNDYKGFKRVVHDAHNPGDNAPPVPHPSTWFPDEATTSNTPATRRRRMASRTDNTDNAEDDEILVTGETASLKCPLTLRTFKEPYSNHKCKHTFEKDAILQLHRENATVFVDPSQGRRGRKGPAGPKVLKCPATQCEAMLELKDFYDDQLILRQVRREAVREAAEMGEEDGEDDGPVNSQKLRRETMNVGTSDIDEEEESQPVKRERRPMGRVASEESDEE